MWVLSPMLPAASQRAVEEGGSIPNPVQFLTSGSITIGRPAKKGGTTGKADLLIFGESSVSTVHAVLEVKSSGAEGASAAVTMTDLGSKFGTFVCHGHQTSRQEQRLEPHQPQLLQKHDIIRFGTKCRYQLHHIPLTIYQNRHHQNIWPDRQPRFPPGSTSPDVDWMQGAGYAHRIGADILACFDAEGIKLGTCGTEDSYCVAAERGQLSTTALAAMALNVQVVTLDWMAAVAAKKAHAGSLPDPAGFAVQQLLLPTFPGVKAVNVRDWKRPPVDFLGGYVLLFHEDHDDNLAAAARAFGAEVHTECHEGCADVIEQAATARGRAAVSVLSEAACLKYGSERVQPQITEDDLLHMIVNGDISALNRMVEEHRMAKEAAAKAKQAAEAATAAAWAKANPEAAAKQVAKAQHIAAAAAKVLAATASESVDDTDEGTEGGEEDAASGEQLQAVQPVLHRRSGRNAGARSYSWQRPSSLGLQHFPGVAASPAAKQKAPSKQVAKQAAKSPLQLKPSTPGRGRGSKRAAAAVEAAAAAAEDKPATITAAAAATAGGAALGAPGGRKRRKLADTMAAAAAARPDNADDDAVVAPAATPAAAAATNIQQQQDNVPTPQPVAAAGGGSSGVVNGNVDTAALTELREGVFAAALVVPTPQQQRQQASMLQNSNGYSGVNFKAFRRKQQPGGSGQAGSGQPVAAPATAGCVINLVPESKGPSGPDTDAFLREERQRMERLKKADDLFNATIKPIAKPTARGRAKH